MLTSTNIGLAIYLISGTEDQVQEVESKRCGVVFAVVVCVVFLGLDFPPELCFLLPCLQLDLQLTLTTIFLHSLSLIVVILDFNMV